MTEEDKNIRIQFVSKDTERAWKMLYSSMDNFKYLMDNKMNENEFISEGDIREVVNHMKQTIESIGEVSNIDIKM
jgi:hypothetical protein